MRRARAIFVTFLVTATAVLATGVAKHAGPHWPAIDAACAVPQDLQPLLWQTLNEDADDTFAFTAALDDQMRFVASNRIHGFTASFGTDGVKVDAGATPLTMQLIAFGRHSMAGAVNGSMANGRDTYRATWDGRVWPPTATEMDRLTPPLRQVDRRLL